MIKLLRNRSDFIRNSATLISGTAIAQAISLIFSPVITRLYTPAAFGTFTFLISVIGGFGWVATLRFEMAIVLPKKEKDAVNLAFISIGTAFMICLCIAFSVFVINTWFLGSFTMDPLYKYLLCFIPVMVFMIASGNVFQNWFNRQKEYKTLALSKVLSSVGNNFGTLYLGFIGIGVFGLLIGNLAGLLLFNLFFIFVAYKKHKSQISQYDRSGQRSLVRQYRDLPLANTPQMLVELVQLYGIIFLLQMFYSSEILGWYSLSLRLLQAPMWLVGTSIAQVFYKDASEKYQKDDSLYTLVLKTLKIATLVALPVLLVMITIGPWVISLIFGKAWFESGQITRILAPWFFFDFIRYTISQTPLIIRKTRQMFWISLTGAACMLLTITGGALFFHNVRTVFLLLSALMSCYSIGVIWWILMKVKLSR